MGQLRLFKSVSILLLLLSFTGCGKIQKPADLQLSPVVLSSIPNQTVEIEPNSEAEKNIVATVTIPDASGAFSQGTTKANPSGNTTPKSSESNPNKGVAKASAISTTNSSKSSSTLSSSKPTTTSSSSSSSSTSSSTSSTSTSSTTTNTATNTPAQTSPSTPIGTSPVIGSFTKDDLYWLAKLICAEADAEPYDGQVAVGAVVLHRVASPNFPNTIKGVEFQIWEGYYQFTCVQNGWINKVEPNSTSYRAAKDAFAGVDPSLGAIGYYNPATSTSKWVFTRPITTVIANHTFTK